MGNRGLVDLLGLGLRVAGNADRIAGDTGHGRHHLPQGLSDERDDGVGQAQDGFERADQRAARGALLRFGAVLDLHLGDLQVPVAVLVPDKVVDRVGHVVQAVFLKALGDFGLGLLQQRADPAVGLAELHVAVGRASGLAFFLGVLFQAAILAFAVHQHKAAGVPELVAEVAVALAALAVEVDAAAQRRQCGKGEAQRIGAIGRDALGELLLRVLAHRGRSLGLAQAGGALVEQRLQRNAVDQVHRVEHVAFGLGHLLALRVAHQAVDVHVLERHAAGEVRGHHDHPGDPEEDDVVARDQHGAGQVEVEVVGVGGALVRPAHGAEGHERGRVPGVQHVFIAAQRLAGGLGLGFGFVAGHDHVAVFVVPRRDLVAPPQLAADAPVLDVVHPLVVGVHPVLGHKGHFATGHGIDGLLRNALAGGVAFAHLAHRHEPLVGQHGLDHLAGAGADRHHELVLLHLDQRADGLEVGHHGLAGHEAVHALVLGGRVLVDGGLQGQHHDHGQLVALAHGVVVLVVRRRYLHHARAELLVHVLVGDHRDLAVAQRQVHHLADQVRVA
ncbi:hypothetical protein D3C71_1094660 [compost metagenome]